MLLNEENHTFSICFSSYFFSSYLSAPLYLPHQITFSHPFFNNTLQVCVLTEVSGTFSIGLPVLKSKVETSGAIFATVFQGLHYVFSYDGTASFWFCSTLPLFNVKQVQAVGSFVSNNFRCNLSRVPKFVFSPLQSKFIFKSLKVFFNH